MGRSYGGGLLELEPSECVSLPVPDPNLVPDELVDVVDSLLRQGKIDEALSAVDQPVLIAGAGFALDQVVKVQEASRRLRERRLGRGRGGRRVQD